MMSGMKSFGIFLVVFLIFVCSALFFGCSSSKPQSDQDKNLALAREQDYRNQVNRLKSSLDSLKQVHTRLGEDFQKSQQDNSNLNIRLSEVEKELNELKTRSTFNSEEEVRRKKYAEALSLFYAKKYNEAVVLFQKLYTEDPGGDLAPNCVYWVGESFYGLKDYKQSSKSFEQVLSAYPGSIKSDAALLMLGNSYLKQKEKAQAKEFFERLQQQYPASIYLSKIPKEFIIKAGNKNKKETEKQSEK